MKRLFISLLVLLLAFSLTLAACSDGDTSQNGSSDSALSSDSVNSESPEESSFDSSEESSEPVSEDSAEDSSEEPSDDSSEESSEPEPELLEDSIDIKCTRYAESKPTFFILGTCAQGAQITAELDGESVTVESYMGWFTVSFTKNGTRHDVTFTQTVNGEEYDVPRTRTVRPTDPGNTGQKVIASNVEFQFFLNQMLPDYKGGNLFSKSQIANMTNRISSRLESMQEYNPDAEIIYMVIPSAMTIYPELVPDTYTHVAEGESRLDQVLEGIEASGATVIDVRDTFMEHKNDEMPLYYKLDSHWADYGAYLAYVELFNHIAEKYPAAAPRDMEDFDWNPDYYKSADVVMYMGYQQSKVQEYGYYREFAVEVPSQVTAVPRFRLPQLLYSEESVAERVFNTNRDELPSCILYRDSFGAGVYDILPERMDTTHYISMWNYYWNSRMIESEQPDYVIYLLAEWNLREVVYN